MSQIQEIPGIPTKEKANEIARQTRLLRPEWTVEVIGNTAPYTVRATPPTHVGTNASSVAADRTATESMTTFASPRTGILGFLDFIAQYESNGNYNARYGAAANTNDPAFTSMNINEVLAWQEDRKFSACGKYQIIRQTLAGLVQTLGLSGLETFNPTLQDKMGEQLLKNRGFDEFLAGTMARDEFALRVAREWAALPGVKEPYGEKSVYAGDGVNHALVTVSTYLSAINRFKASA